MEQACPADAPADGEVDRLRRLYDRNPTSTIFARLADAFLVMGDVRGAIDVCRQGLRYRPSYITGHLVLARALAAAGDHRRAEDEFQKVLRLEPGNPASVRYLASLAERAGDDERAAQLWDRLRTLDPANAAFQSVETVDPDPADEPEPEQVDSPTTTAPQEEPVDAEAEAKGDFPFVSLTLARLYASQGHRGRAEKVVRLVDPAQADDLMGQLAPDA